MKTDDFDYYLPEELIAQVPLEHREESRLLVLDKNNGNMIDDKFYDIVNYLNKGDILVLNDTKVMPARLIGEKKIQEQLLRCYYLRILIRITGNV